MSGDEEVAGRGANPGSAGGEDAKSYSRYRRRRKQIRTAADVDPPLLALFPNLVEELNAVIIHARDGDGWAIFDITLDQALALPTWGSA